MVRIRRPKDPHTEYRLLAAAAVDGRLDADSAAALEAHLATCLECRADLEAMRADHAWLAEPAAATWPSASVRSFVMDAARGPRVPQTSERRGSLVPVSAAALAIVLVGLVGLSLGQSGPVPGSTSSAARPSEPATSVEPTVGTQTVEPRVTGAATQIPISTSPIPRVGERLRIWPSPPATFPADTPFYLGQGYCFDSTDVNPEQTARDPGTAVDFFIDGVAQVTQQELFIPGDGACVVGTGWVVNVPDGLPAGSHHLAAHWYLSGTVDQVRAADVLFE